MARRREQDMKKTKPIPSVSKSVPTASPQQPMNGAPTAKAANGTVIPAELRTRIETLAYELYQRRGRQDGYDEQDWLEAERITLSQPSAISKTGAGHLLTETLA